MRLGIRHAAPPGGSASGEAFDVMQTSSESRYILGMRVDVTAYDAACRRILTWAAEPRGRVVCCANVHMAMECFDDERYRRIINSADLVTADGMPLVWALHRLGARSASRVYGPDLTRVLLAEAAARSVPVAFFGGSPATLRRLLEAVRERYPGLLIAGAWSPPFRPPSASEDQKAVDDIRASGARLLFVGLGCPKQERWMEAHRNTVAAVMLGVGAAFDFLAGVKPQAPPLVQRTGFEWLFRLAVEPSRLWRRYLHTNPRFLLHCGSQLLRTRIGVDR